MIRNKFGSSATVFIIYTIESDVAFREVPFCVRFKEACAYYISKNLRVL